MPRQSPTPPLPDVDQMLEKLRAVFTERKPRAQASFGIYVRPGIRKGWPGTLIGWKDFATEESGELGHLPDFHREASHAAATAVLTELAMLWAAAAPKKPPAAQHVTFEAAFRSCNGPQ